MLLYKFRAISGISFKYTEDIFVNKRLFFPTANRLNDPNEGVALIEIQNQYRTWGNQLKERNRRSKTRICAFSETHRNAVLWSHYADEHKGICIEFESDHINNQKVVLKPVTYSNTIPTFKHNSGIDEKEAFLNKTAEWAYEKEWRYMGNETPTFLEFDENAIKRVLLGVRFPNSDLSHIQIWLSNYAPNRSIPIVKMKSASTDYSLYEESEMTNKTSRIG